VAAGQGLDDLRPHVVARLGVLLTGVAEADDEQVGRRPRPGAPPEHPVLLSDGADPAGPARRPIPPRPPPRRPRPPRRPEPRRPRPPGLQPPPRPRPPRPPRAVPGPGAG